MAASIQLKRPFVTIIAAPLRRARALRALRAPVPPGVVLAAPPLRAPRVAPVSAVLAAALDEEQRQDMASIADQLIAKGEKRGIEKGIEKGQRALVQRLLQRRFGPLPPEALARLAAAAPSELEQWAERVLVAATLAEVLDGAP